MPIRSVLIWIKKLLVKEFFLFAIPHHLKTFLSPFRRVTTSRNRQAIVLSDIAEMISFNLVSVGIGVIARSVVLFLGFSLMVMTTLFGGLLFILTAIFLPFLLAISEIKKYSSQKELLTYIRLAEKSAGKALAHLLTGTKIGRFLCHKLVIGSQDFLEMTSLDVCLVTKPETTSLKELIKIYANSFEPFKKFLDKNLFDEDDLDRVFLWFDNLTDPSVSPFLRETDPSKISGIGSSWSYGYTNNLDKYQLRQGFGQFPLVVGREKEITSIEQSLTKTSQNSCLVLGEPGVGRHAVVDEFSRRLFSGNVSRDLVGLRTIYLDMNTVLSSSPNPQEAKNLLLNLFDEARSAGNIILVIDQIDRFFGSSNDDINLTDVFSQTLSSGEIRIIGISSKEVSDKLFSRNEVLLKLFTPIVINSPDVETVFLEMEMSIVPILEEKNKVEISYSAVKEAIQSSDRFITNVPFPEKAINLLDETISFVKNDHQKMQLLWGSDVQRYLSTKNQIPIGNLTEENKAKLANLEESLHQQVIGQETAVSALSKALRRAILNVSSRNKPIGTFLFLGPTGVGKTETSKALAVQYFGGENRLIRFDMSQYQGEEGIQRLIGNSQSNKPGELTQALSDHPFSVLLLDEIEKAPQIVLNLFLTLIDEGYLTDATGKRFSARENIIIGTSNAGALFIKEASEKGTPIDEINSGLLNFVQEQKIFSPEFLNRFDGVIVFRPLSKDELKLVVKKLLGGLSKRLLEKKINVEFTNETIEKIVTEGYDPAFGARSVRRYIQDVIEDEISKSLLTGNPNKLTI